MPTPNWGPQSGVPMDEATFDAYVVSNPPGAAATPAREVTSNPMDTLMGASRAAGGGSYDPHDPMNAAPGAGVGAQGARHWESFFADGPASVQMPTFQTANQDQARQQQQQVIQDLQRAAMGDPSSRAQQGLRDAYGGATSQQSSLGSTMRGQDAGAAMRGIQAGQQGIQRGFAGDQQQLQLQEQLAAQQMLAQVLSQQQGQDINQAQGMAQGINQGNAMDEAMRQFYTQGRLESGLGRENRVAQGNRAALGIAQGYGDLAQTGINGAVGAGAGLLGTLGTMGNKKSSQQTIDDAFYG